MEVMGGWREHEVSPTLYSILLLTITSQIYKRKCDFLGNPGMLIEFSPDFGLFINSFKNKYLALGGIMN